MAHGLVPVAPPTLAASNSPARWLALQAKRKRFLKGRITMPDPFGFFFAFVVVCIILIALLGLYSAIRGRSRPVSPGASRNAAEPLFPLEMNRGINEQPVLEQQQHHHHHEPGFSPMPEHHHHSPPPDPPAMHHHF
jgi:hypothetical protein